MKSTINVTWHSHIHSILVELTFPPLESTLSPIISSCSLPPPLRLFSIGTANIVPTSHLLVNLQAQITLAGGQQASGTLTLLPLSINFILEPILCWHYSCCCCKKDQESSEEGDPSSVWQAWGQGDWWWQIWQWGRSYSSHQCFVFSISCGHPLTNKKGSNQNLLYREMSTRSGSNLVLCVPINFYIYTCNTA